MRTNLIRKGAVGCAAVLGLLLALASPASADTIGHMEVTGGTLSAAGQVFDLDPDEGPQGPCILPDGNLAVDFAPNTPASSGTWTISGGWKSQFQLGTPPAGPWYQADFSIVSGGGTWAHTGANTSSLASSAPNHVIFQVRIYELNPETCLKDNLKCIINARVQFSGTWSSATSNLTSVVVGDQATLNGTSLSPHMVVSSCQAPFTSFGGQVATISGLVLTVTSTSP